MKSNHRKDEPKTSTGVLKFPYMKVGGVLGATLTFLILFDQVVPSKAKVEDLSVRITALERLRSTDHDALIRLEGDVKYIRDWVERQQKVTFSRPRDNPMASGPLP